MKSPVLLYGDGRSGTTMLQLILDSHSELYMGGETHFNSGIDLGKSIIDRTHKGFIAKIDRCGVSVKYLQYLVHTMGAGYKGESITDRCKLMKKIGEIKAKDYGKSHWGFKMMRALGFYHQCPWKDAQHIFIVRDPRDVYASQKQWQGKPGQKGSWGYKSPLECGNTWNSLVQQWANRLPNNSFLIKYEDIIIDPEHAIRLLCEQINLEYESGMLDWTGKPHALFDSKKSHYSKEQLKSPMNDDSMGRWKRDLNDEESSTISVICRREMEDLEYEA